MSENVSIIGLKDILRKFGLLSRKLENRALMGEVGEYVIAKIQARTQDGVDADETPFKPYSPKYALFRTENNRDADPVNLTWFGTMMSSMTYDADRDKVTIFFQNIDAPNPPKGEGSTPVPVKAYFLNQERRFFAMADEDVEFIGRMFRKYLNNLTRKK